jgi:UV excision repair protein RAD23
VKECIEKTHQLGAASGMKLIYAGKILQDEMSVAQCSISENAFLVLMVSKPKAAPAAPKEIPYAPLPPSSRASCLWAVRRGCARPPCRAPGQRSARVCAPSTEAPAGRRQSKAD